MLEKEDLKLIRKMISAGQALEKELLSSDLMTPEKTELPEIPRYQKKKDELKSLLDLCEERTNPDVNRLSKLKTLLDQPLSLRNLTALLVPFERLNGRSLRDDEFLLSTNDLTAENIASLGPLRVIAENIRSSFNVGAIFRTAECFGIEKIHLTGYTSTPESEKTANTSMGTSSLVEWQSHRHSSEVISELKKDGYRIVALETVEGAISIEQYRWPEKAALLLGNERFGLDMETLASADDIIRIPLSGRKNSLNVGVAFGIGASAWRTQHNQKLKSRESKSSVTSKSDDRVDRQEFKPIGYFSCPLDNPYEVPRQGVLNQSQSHGAIRLTHLDNIPQSIKDLEGFERIWVVYKFHQNSNWKPLVLPPRGPKIKRGVLSTRSPYRPNPIGISCVKLEKIKGNTIYVSEFDLLNGTPIYDIKPYLPYSDSFPSARAGWVDSLQSSVFQIEYRKQSHLMFDWLLKKGVPGLADFISSQLSSEPTDEKRKRIKALASDSYFIAYRTWRVLFTIDFETSKVYIEGIKSGYSESDLQDPSDPYGDKSIHRHFNKEFSL